MGRRRRVGSRKKVGLGLERFVNSFCMIYIADEGLICGSCFSQRARGDKSVLRRQREETLTDFYFFSFRVMNDDDTGDASAAAAADEREDVQKKTFGKWINSQLASAKRPDEETVTDLYYDLRDGRVLISVLEILTGKTLKRERGSLRVHQLSNLNTVFSVLRENRVKIVNIGNVDIVDGNAKITLALVWAIILHWQFNKVIGEGAHHVSNLEKSLLAWCRQATSSYSKVNVTDFGHSWQDGLAFNALLHSFRPHLFDFDKAMAERPSPASKLDFAFSNINQHLGIARLLDPEDLVSSSKPDKKSVMTYLMCVFQVLPHDDIDMSQINDISIVSDPGFRANESIGSPLKTPIKDMTNGKDGVVFLLFRRQCREKECARVCVASQRDLQERCFFQGQIEKKSAAVPHNAALKLVSPSNCKRRRAAGLIFLSDKGSYRDYGPVTA